jgi:hypothetical protein
VPTGVISQPAAGLLAKLGGGRLVGGDGGVTYWFAGIERDAERLMNAAKLVATFAAGPAAGVFR